MDGDSWWEIIKKTISPIGTRTGPRRRIPIPESTVLDLHGMTVQEAYLAVAEFISTRSCTDVLIITGKSGIIRKECPVWLDLNKKIRFYVEENGGGAFRIKLCL